MKKIQNESNASNKTKKRIIKAKGPPQNRSLLCFQRRFKTKIHSKQRKRILCKQDNHTLIPPTGYTIQQFNKKLYDPKNKTRRKFVRGALYKTEIDDCTLEPMELLVELANGSCSTIKAVNLNFEEKVMEELISAGAFLSREKGNARADTGDEGKMDGIGRRTGGSQRGYNKEPLFAMSDPNSKSYNEKFTKHSD